MRLGHSKTGVSNLVDFDNRLYRGLILTKSAPISNSNMEMSPVDWVSKAIVTIALSDV